ncbi:DUF5987 family protein [Micromonospora sp. NBC_01699]|uniref:DUF5987 family protein n=1 Tax=Micromonospora sp. NBC_01699 TaxID=2975984 RepID=UPI002E321D52|nr:DUF5987 family protein [Micromonospora sp. NBC_01699]
MTLEAYADTIVPGERRTPDDRAIAGVSVGGGAVASGAVELLELPGSGLGEMLEGFMAMLNGHAEEYAAEQSLTLDESVPAFVALPFPDRTALVVRLTAQDHPEKGVWIGLAMFSNMAFDSAAHMPTLDALAAGHPGLLTIGYLKPEPDGVWRFPRFSYGRALSQLHPHTTATGSPA